MKVDHGGLNRLVPQEHLDLADVVSHLQKMGGEAMSKSMDAFSLFDLRFFLRLRIGALLRGRCADVLFRILAWKQPLAGAANFVVVAQLRQESFGENRVAILAPLARLHSDEHSGTVDVLGLQGDDFADSQSRGIRGLQQDPVLQVGRRASTTLRTSSGARTSGSLRSPVFFGSSSLTSSLFSVLL